MKKENTFIIYKLTLSKCFSIFITVCFPLGQSECVSVFVTRSLEINSQKLRGATFFFVGVAGPPPPTSSREKEVKKNTRFTQCLKN